MLLMFQPTDFGMGFVQEERHNSGSKGTEALHGLLLAVFTVK